jgi:hypothetical protein
MERQRLNSEPLKDQKKGSLLFVNEGKELKQDTNTDPQLFVFAALLRSDQGKNEHGR